MRSKDSQNAAGASRSDQKDAQSVQKYAHVCISIDTQELLYQRMSSRRKWPSQTGTSWLI